MMRHGRIMTMKTGINEIPIHTASIKAIRATAIAIGKRTTVIKILQREQEGPKNQQ